MTPCFGHVILTWPGPSALEHVNPAYLPGLGLALALSATTDLEKAVCDADLLVVGVPTSGFRCVLEEAAG